MRQKDGVRPRRSVVVKASCGLGCFSHSSVSAAVDHLGVHLRPVSFLLFCSQPTCLCSSRVDLDFLCVFLFDAPEHN